MNEALEQLEPLTIESYNLSFYSYEDMLKLAGDIEITKFKASNPKSPDAKKLTEFGAINDIRMGTMSLTDKCITCSGINCPGHWGIIKFGKDNEIMNPLVTRQVIMILNCVCHDCSRLLFANELTSEDMTSTELAAILKKPVDKRLTLLEKYCAKIKQCPITYDKHLNIKPCRTHVKLKALDVKDDGIVQYYEPKEKGKKGEKKGEKGGIIKKGKIKRKRKISKLFI